jgi:GDP-mannose 6-dehydrogenase
MAMRVAVFGLGYVGCVTAACLAEAGHTVVGIDVNAAKVAAVNAGRSPVIEPGLGELVTSMVRAGRLSAAVSTGEVSVAEVSLICVGTPSLPNGDVDTSFVLRAVNDLAAGRHGSRGGRHLIVVRSTLFPGSTEELLIPALEAAAGQIEGEGFDVVYNPEFLREGSGVQDFRTPARIVIGARRREAGEAVGRLYEAVRSPVVLTSIRTAEMVKYADNAFHALKVAFANEIGSLARAQGLDGDKVMRIFRMDTQLNLSGAYLKPGNAFGGSCLPKDLRALVYCGHKSGIETPLLEATLTSNAAHMRRAEEAVVGTGARTIAVIGIAFKPETDDLRESPAVDLVGRLLRRGLEVRIFDPQVRPDALLGENLRYLLTRIPSAWAVFRARLEEALERAEVVILSRGDLEILAAVSALHERVILVDLGMIIDDPSVLRCRYVALAR